jgi:hypothetical protein
VLNRHATLRTNEIFVMNFLMIKATFVDLFTWAYWCSAGPNCNWVN